MTRRPTAVEPVKETIATSGWPTRCCAGDRAGAGDDVDDAGGGAGLGERLGEEERGERGDLGGLEDDRVAGGDGGQDLPRGHLQRVVPRGDRADDADRLAADRADVWSPEYSALAMPSRRRAAVPKNAVLSTVPGTSNSRASRIGLPAWRLSSRASSSARSSSSWAALSRTVERSTGVARLHSSKAAPAAATAASTSAWPARVTVSMVSLVLGSRTSKVSPEDASRRCAADVLVHGREHTHRLGLLKRGVRGAGSAESAAKARVTASDRAVRPVGGSGSRSAGWRSDTRAVTVRSQEHFARSGGSRRLRAGYGPDSAKCS